MSASSSCTPFGSSPAFCCCNAFCTAAACACEAPFLWLLLGTVGASEFLDGRDRPFLLRGPSGKLPIAGVEGLLALPLFVVVTCCVVAFPEGVDSFCTSPSSALGLMEPFLSRTVAVVAEDGVGARSLCWFAGSALAVALGGSICVTLGVSLGPRAPLFWGISSGAGTPPFGLLEAAEGGRCFVVSTLDATEL